jgi:hypothetical protein
MAVVLGTITYKDGTGTPVTVQAYINNTPVPNVVFPGGTLFDHLGNVLTVDIGGSVGAGKVTLMKMAQIVGSVAHGSADTHPPVKSGADRGP